MPETERSRSRRFRDILRAGHLAICSQDGQTRGFSRFLHSKCSLQDLLKHKFVHMRCYLRETRKQFIQGDG